MKINRVIKSAIFLTLLALGSLIFYSKSEQKVSEEIPNYQYQIDQPRVITYDKGKKRWDLRAVEILIPKSEDEKKETEVILKKIKDGKLYKKGAVEYILDADEVVYFKEQKNATLKGSVKLNSLDGEEIETEELDWIDKRKELVTNTDVKVKFKDGELFAKKMRMDVDNNIIDFSGEVEMEFEIKGVEKNEE